MDSIPKYTDVVQALVDMVTQHCRDGDRLQDYGLSANDHALDLLEKLGLVVKENNRYRFREGDHG